MDVETSNNKNYWVAKIGLNSFSDGSGLFATWNDIDGKLSVYNLKRKIVS